MFTLILNKNIHDKMLFTYDLIGQEYVYGILRGSAIVAIITKMIDYIFNETLAGAVSDIWINYRYVKCEKYIKMVSDQS